MAKKKADLGSKAWAIELREEVKAEVAKVEMSYLELARLLYEVYDIPVDNDPSKGPIYTAWGYKTFKAYTEEELGIHEKKARSLRRIWYIFETDLKEMDPALRERIMRLGWTKVRELCRVLTMKNAAKWCEKAEEMTLAELVATITAYRQKALEKQREKHAEKMGDAVAGASFSAPESNPGEEAQAEVETGSYAADSADLEDHDDEAPAKFNDIPLDEVPDKLEVQQKVFGFYPDQLTIVNEALDLAQQMSGSDVKSHNLTMICTDFLSTTMKGRSDEQWKAAILARLEAILGYDLIALDPKSGDFVYGIQAANRLVKQGKKHGAPAQP